MSRVTVEGTSMLPHLHPGDRLWVWPWLRPRPGDIVAVKDPRQPDRVLVKRVASVGPDGALEVRGDTAEASTDSRQFGPVPPSLLMGVAVYRYAPSDRVGMVRRRGGSQARRRSK